MSSQRRTESGSAVVNLVPAHIDVCSTCGYGAVKPNYPCSRCGQIGITRFVPSELGGVQSAEMPDPSPGARGQAAASLPAPEPRITELPTTWPNGVPYIDEDTRRENFDDPVALRDLIAHIELHGAYHGRALEITMTTEQKELYADVLDWNAATQGFNTKHDRWWQRA